MANEGYLEQDRLAYVIAAIQIMGVSEYASGSLNRWIAELEASEDLTPELLDKTPIRYADRKKWQTIFEQHPEFFKSYTLRGEARVSLRWRFAQAIDYDQATETVATPEEQVATGDTEQAGNEEQPMIASQPLTADQIQVLITTAIELHSRAAAAQPVHDRYRPVMMTALGAALGTIAGGALILILGWSPMVRIFH